MFDKMVFDPSLIFFVKMTFSLFAADSHNTEVSCYLYYPVIPQSLDLTVTAAYISGQGIPVILTNVTSLPIKLIVKPCAPIKEADYKVTLSTNKPAVSLLELFPGKYYCHYAPETFKM